MRSDFFIGEAAFERLTEDHWVALVEVEDAGQVRIDLFALEPGHNPYADGGRAAADEIIEHYMRAAH